MKVILQISAKLSLSFKIVFLLSLIEVDVLNTNMKVLFVTNKYFSGYKNFRVALKSHYTTSFDFLGKHSTVKPDVRSADISVILL